MTQPKTPPKPKHAGHTTVWLPTHLCARIDRLLAARQAAVIGQRVFGERAVDRCNAGVGDVEDAECVEVEHDHRRASAVRVVRRDAIEDALQHSDLVR